MGWRINLTKNTVTVSHECAVEIAKSETDIGFWIQDNSGGYRDDMITEACRSDGTLRFHGDHMEHMDYVWSIKDILCRHKVKGDIAFSSSDGDNAGTAWCYRFDGEGNCEELRQDLGSMWD